MTDYSPESFTEDAEKLLISYMLADPVSFTLSQNILKPEYFNDRLKRAVEYIKGYAEEFKSLPTTAQISAFANVQIDAFAGVSSQNTEWYLKTVEEFCRYRALELAVLNGVELVQKGKGAELEKQVRDALTISLMRDLGTSYFEDPETRLKRLQDKSNYLTTGWSSLDKKLYGGFTRGSLNIFAGGSGSGKSLFLQNLALNYVFNGFNVIYITLELSEDLVNMRLDAMVTGQSTSDVMRDITRAANIVKNKAAQSTVGDLKVKKFPEAGTTSNDLRAYLKEYEIQEGRKPDVLIVDYLDLMHPNNAKIDVSSLFTKDKFVSEELRAIGSDWDIPVISASQLNRQSVEAQEFDHSHIAGGISKINTADNVFAIFTSMTMKESGRYKIQFLKTRSSNVVGQSLELAYDPTCMRITDAPHQSEAIITMQPLDQNAIRNAVEERTSASMGSTPKFLQQPAGQGPISSQIMVGRADNGGNDAPPPWETPSATYPTQAPSEPEVDRVVSSSSLLDMINSRKKTSDL